MAENTEKPPDLTVNSIDDVERLVKELYQHGSPKYKAQIQMKLQEIQRLQEGWQMADMLLAKEDPNVRFFGALTFTVKITLEGSTLNEENSTDLRSRLTSWLVRLTSMHEQKLVIRKLTLALAKFYFEPTVPSIPSVRQLICSTSKGVDAPPDSLSQYPSTPNLLNHLTHEQVSLLLQFCTSLAEEAQSQVGWRPQMDVAKVESRMKEYVDDTASVLAYAISISHPIRTEALTCWNVWVHFAVQSSSWTGSRELQLLQTLINPIISISTEDSDTAGTALGFLGDLLDDHKLIFDNPHLQLIREVLLSAWASEKMEGLHYNDPDLAEFQTFLLGYADVVAHELVEMPNDAAYQSILGLLHNLLKTEGYAANEDFSILDAQAFWNTYVEIVVEQYEESCMAVGPERTRQAEWVHVAKMHILQMVEEFWAKLRFPPPNDFKTWDTDSKRAFAHFRRDVTDLLQSAEVFLGIELLAGLSTITQDSISKKDWSSVEASLYCMNALADRDSDEDALNKEDELMQQIFGSTLFQNLAELGAEIPPRARKTAMDLFDNYSPFFLRHPEYLAPALTFLFTSLESPALAGSAAKAIHSLSSACRGSLTTQLEAFIQQYERFLSWPTADVYNKEKTIGAIAAIIQALPKDEDKVVALDRILDFVEGDIRFALESMVSGRIQQSKMAAMAAIEALASIGKSCQAPDDMVIDLDADPDQPNFWTNGLGKTIQDRVIRLLFNVIEVWEEDGEVVEQVCSIFSTGFKEAAPGPFVLPAMVFVDFFKRTPLESPRIDQVLSTTSAFIQSHIPSSTPRIDAEAKLVLDHLIELLHIINTPSAEPEAAQGCIDAIRRYFTRYIGVVLQLQPADNLAKVFSFSIEGLQCAETLTKLAAVHFWNDFLALMNQPAEIQGTLDQVVVHFGPSLAKALIQEVGGRAVQSELPALVGPLRLLVTRHSGAQRWLEDACGDDFPVYSLPTADRAIFISRLLASRTGGLSAARLVVSAFWSEARTAAMKSGIDVRKLKK
ncbi:ARM repeat-containing protein [Aulographum hederae CBS 113979]|uniref:ARM repeat-containing protein n=1 Tax=Aulographum hederae CBS 113979 TaxID=1176131 RepID=A0A6G1GY74_9PEZI|nr:ARM repeat-containing protein [Aulographum hederae CBS 113979]